MGACDGFDPRMAAVTDRIRNRSLAGRTYCRDMLDRKTGPGRRRGTLASNLVRSGAVAGGDTDAIRAGDNAEGRAMLAEGR